MQEQAKAYFPCLEGIRALAFILVFLVHFSGPTYLLTYRPAWQYPWFLGCFLSCCAVPIFFALSGYLITGILFDSRHKSGYFRVFYLRRIVRVFPLYYIALLIALGFGLSAGTHFYPHHLLFLVYLHNLWVPNTLYTVHPYINIGHLWSLAVEEQFYLVWPVVVWFLRSRKSLLTFCYVTIAVSFLARCAWPWLNLPAFFAYQNTLYRCDALMMGSALLLHQRGPVKTFDHLVKPAWMTIAIGSAVIIARGLAVGQATSVDTFGVIVILPLLSLMGAAVLVLTLTPGTLVNRASQWKWAVFLGKRSYGLYVFHQFFLVYFLSLICPAMIPYVGRGLARSIGTITAFGLTYLMATLAYRFVETPALNLKRVIRYGEDGQSKSAGIDVSFGSTHSTRPPRFVPRALSSRLNGESMPR